MIIAKSKVHPFLALEDTYIRSNRQENVLKGSNESLYSVIASSEAFKHKITFGNGAPFLKGANNINNMHLAFNI